MVNIKNAIDVAMRTIKNRYDFQGTSAALLNNKIEKYYNQLAEKNNEVIEKNSKV